MRTVSAILVTFYAASLAAQAPFSDADERLLREHNVAVDDAGLLRFFRDRTLSAEQFSALKKTIERLGSPKFNVRNQAAEALVKAGLNAKAILQDAMQNPASDREVARRAELCLRQITDGNEIPLAQAAARLLAQRQSAEAGAVLIRYVSFAGDPKILESVQETLNVVAVRGGRPDASILEAVNDEHPGRRLAAGVALVRAGGTTHKNAVAHLLKDPLAKVRVPVTIALVEAKDKDTVPLLIERLTDTPVDQVWPIVDLLERIAGDKTPAVYLSSKTTPTQVRDAWRKWWSANAATVDLSKLSEAPPYLGYTLISQMTTKAIAAGGVATSGRVVELRPDRSVHFEIANLSYPLDARVIGPNKVLIAEYQGRRVTERDFQGNILWEVPAELPIACQRLPGGDTFVVTRKQLFIVDADKKTTFSYFPPSGTISAAQRLRDGHIVLIATTGQCHWLDPQGKEIKSFQVGYVYALGGNIEVLPNRHLLVPLYRDGKVAEFDPDGNMVWHIATPSPVSATRLPNGHVLVVYLSNRGVHELDRQGQSVWTYPVEGRAWRARGR